MSQSKRTWRRRIGRVTVYLRGNRYWIYYRQGKQVRRPVGTSKEEALALAAKINAQLAEGAPTILAFQPIAVDALVAKWLDHHEHVRRSSLATVRRYRTAVGHLAGFVQRDFGKLRANRFDSSKAEDFVRHLRKAEVSPNGHANTQKRRMRDKGVVFVLGMLPAARKRGNPAAIDRQPVLGEPAECPGGARRCPRVTPLRSRKIPSANYDALRLPESATATAHRESEPRPARRENQNHRQRTALFNRRQQRVLVRPIYTARGILPTLPEGVGSTAALVPPARE